MKSGYSFKLKDQHLILLPEKAIYWKERKTLLVADVHLGKAGHFQKSGLNVPYLVLENDLEIFDKLFDTYEINRILVLGDLFHAEENNEWKVFGEWLLKKNVSFQLVKGNHDILSFDAYEKYNIIIHDKILIEDPFVFSHFPLEACHEIKGKFIISGHIHPAIEIKGKGYQSVRVECFYFGENQAILPAFGSFTGNKIIEKHPGVSIFVIAGDKVKPLKIDLD